MRPVRYKVQLVNVTDGIAEAQLVTDGSFFDFSFGGTPAPNVVDGIAILTLGLTGISKQAQFVTAASGSNANDGTSLIIIGTDVAGNPVTDTITCPDTSVNAGTSTSTKFFATVISVQAVDSDATDVKLGWDASKGSVVTSSALMDWRQNPANITISEQPVPADKTNGISAASIQYSFDDPDGELAFSYSDSAAWIPFSTLASMTVATDDVAVGPQRALRGFVGPSDGTEEQWVFDFIMGNTY